MSKINLENSLVVVTGANSMIGNEVCNSLLSRGAVVKAIVHEHDLYHDLSRQSITHKLLGEKLQDDRYKNKYLIHCAGYNGGIEFNRSYPADIYYHTAMMALNVLTEAERFGVDKCLSILASCSHPPQAEELKEESLWDGPPNPSVECHGSAKRILDVYSRQLNKQILTDRFFTCTLTNCYGPRDRFDPLRSKVVGGVIKKVVEAKESGTELLEFWGTGSPLREFMFSKDAAEAIVQTLELYDNPNQPLNIGSGIEVSIKDLVDCVVDIVGYTGQVKWDVTKNDGQMRKLLDTTNMKNVLNVPMTNFVESLRETISWYIANKESWSK